MPGLKKSPGMADIDVCFGAHKAGSEGVQTAMQRARWKYEQARLSDVGTLDPNRYSQAISSPDDEMDAVDELDVRASPVSPLGEGFDDSEIYATQSESRVAAEKPEMQKPSSESLHHKADTDGNGDLDPDLSSSTPIREVEYMTGSPSDSVLVERRSPVGSRLALGVLPSLETELDIDLATSNGALSPVAQDEKLRSAPRSLPQSPGAEQFESPDSGLPPTPPTITDGSEGLQSPDGNFSPPPLFANRVRNTLSPKQSGQNMTPVNQSASPPTPDPSPPRQQQSEVIEVVEKQKSQDLLIPGVFEHDTQQYANSVSGSFKTAQEDNGMKSNTSLSPVHLPDSDRLPKHWLDSTRALQSAHMNLVNVAAKPTPQIGKEGNQRTVTPDKRQHEHLSNGLGIVNGIEKSPSLRQSAEARNNMVYKRLQEESVKRHSTVSANSGAITVGITLPSNDSTPRSLRRQHKRSSLRASSAEDGSKDTRQFSDGGGTATITSAEQAMTNGSARNLKQKVQDLEQNSTFAESPLFRRSTLDDSPLIEASIRNVTSPAKLGEGTSDMTALTYASMQDSPSARRISKFDPSGPTHKLRHVSHEDRLSRNMSVRRTSLENSPPLNDSLFQMKPAKAATSVRQQFAANGKVKDNIAVKRTRPKQTEASWSPSSAKRPEGVPADSSSESQLQRSPGGTLRHFSRENRLENNDSVRRTSLEHATQPVSQHGTQPSTQIETAHRRTSSDKSFVPASPRKSIDARLLHPTTTPMSARTAMSSFSDRTENIEIGEANGVKLYPHTNESLLVVQQSSRPTSKGRDASEAPHFYPAPTIGTTHLSKPTFKANIEPPTPTLSLSKIHHVDSPLTNPRAAPEPPVIKFIPPTPEKELDNQLDGPLLGLSAPMDPDTPRRRLSLVQRARRYSDIMFPNLGSLRKSKMNRPTEARATYLSPLWRPQGFWDEFDSDEDYDDFEAAGTLPRGGDMSDVEASEAQKKSGLLPRAMSKRLPGFRGTGGFLLGNSLGIDRHGTNNRRHYVSTGSRTLSKRESVEVMDKLSSPSGRVSPEQRVMQQRYFVIPFSGGSRAYWVGTRRFRAKMSSMRRAKQERELEKRRDKIRKSIGYRVYHNTDSG